LNSSKKKPVGVVVNNGFTDWSRVGSTVGWVYSWIFCCFDGWICAGSGVTVTKIRSYIFKNYFVLKIIIIFPRGIKNSAKKKRKFHFAQKKINLTC